MEVTANAIFDDSHMYNYFLIQLYVILQNNNFFEILFEI